MSENEEALSQDEVDALLDAEEGTVGEAAGAGHGDDIKPYDFLGKLPVVVGNLPGLDSINDRFSKKMVQGLFGVFKREFDISSHEFSLSLFSDYIESLLLPTSLNIVRLKPLAGVGLLVIEAKLAFGLVESYFGGYCRFNTKIEGRDFTSAETKIIQLAVKSILNDLESIWEKVFPLKFEVIDMEANPLMASIVERNESVLINSFEVNIEGGISGKVQYVIPYKSLKPIKSCLEVNVKAEHEDGDDESLWEESIKQMLLDSDVHISSTLVERDLTLKEIILLDRGDVIPISLSELVTVKVEGRPQFVAKYGEYNGNKALKIMSEIERSS